MNITIPLLSFLLAKTMFSLFLLPELWLSCYSPNDVIQYTTHFVSQTVTSICTDLPAKVWTLQVLTPKVAVKSRTDHAAGHLIDQRSWLPPHLQSLGIEPRDLHSHFWLAVLSHVKPLSNPHWLHIRCCSDAVRSVIGDEREVFTELAFSFLSPEWLIVCVLPGGAWLSTRVKCLPPPRS